jgi:hypothetical protein
MTLVRNPFDAGGYSLAEMTQAINILPNLYTRLGQIGLFRFEGVTQRSVIIEQYEGVLNLLPSVPLGGPPRSARAKAGRCGPSPCRGSRMTTSSCRATFRANPRWARSMRPIRWSR